MATAQRIKSRLRSILKNKNVSKVELINVIAAVLVGAHLMLPFNSFAGVDNSILLHIAGEFYWGFLLFCVGSIKFIMLIEGSFSGRKWTAYILSILWTLLFSDWITNRPYGLFAVFSGIFAGLAAYVVLFVKERE